MRVRPLEAPANTALPRDYRGERAVLVLGTLQTGMRRLVFLDPFDAALPGVGQRKKLRIEGAHQQPQTPDREVRPDQRIGHAGQEVRRRGGAPGIVDQPRNERVLLGRQIAPRLCVGRRAADEPGVHRPPIEGDVAVHAGRLVIRVFIGPDRVFRRTVADLERPVGRVALERTMRMQIVADQELRPDILQREIVDGRQAGLMHQQGVAAFSHRLAIEDDANPVAARLYRDPISIARKRVRGACSGRCDHDENCINPLETMI